MRRGAAQWNEGGLGLGLGALVAAYIGGGRLAEPAVGPLL